MAKTSNCITHDLWMGLNEQIYSYLEEITLQQLVDSHTKRKPTSYHFPEKSDQAGDCPGLKIRPGGGYSRITALCLAHSAIA